MFGRVEKKAIKEHIKLLLQEIRPLLVCVLHPTCDESGHSLVVMLGYTINPCYQLCVG